MTIITTPVVICVFNRPDVTSALMEAIAAAAPARLMVVVDGPRADRPDERRKCETVRDIVRDKITWPCSVSWNVSESNLGCRQRIQSGLSWVFSNVEKAIILEDDCIPDQSFFPYCEALLDRYEGSRDVGLISGFNPIPYLAESSSRESDDSYLFSRYPQILGWATWRSVWHCYEPQLASWRHIRQTDWLPRLLENPLAAAHWRVVFDQIARGSDTWDYAMTYSLWRRNALSIIPRLSMIQNIGFGPDATHTTRRDARADQVRHSLDLPLRHAPHVERDRDFDSRYEQTWCSGSQAALFERVRRSISERK